jgi:hypothetical protein
MTASALIAAFFVIFLAYYALVAVVEGVARAAGKGFAEGRAEVERRRR